MVQVAPHIWIDDGEIQLEFVHASGPGGQNVNKTATAVQLFFDVAHSPSLTDDLRRRLVQVAGKRITDKGVLVIDARRFRSQERNRQDAIARLADMVRQASMPPKPRRMTRPSQAARQRRLAAKRRRSETKRLRHPVRHEE